MTTPDPSRIVSASRDVAASTAALFELIADPSRQPEWDGNDNLAESEPGHRVRAVGEVFETTLTNGQVRANHVTEFVEGRLIAWRPSPVGEPAPGHLWRWELESLGDGGTRVTHTYDWTELHDEERFPRARATTADRLASSIERLAGRVENR